MADFALRWSNNYQLPAPLKDVEFELIGHGSKEGDDDSKSDSLAYLSIH